MQADQAPFPTRHRWVAAVLLGAAGLLLNLQPVPLSPGTDLVFGGAAYLLAAAALGPWQGALAAGIASAPTLFLWGHPYAWIISTLEALAVGHLVRRRDRRPLVADLAYWAALGLPILFLTYWVFLGVRGHTAAVLFLKQPFNGLICALAVETLLLVPSVRRLLGVPGRPPVRAALAVVVALAATVPALGFGVWTGRREWDRSVQGTRERLHLFAQAHAARLEQYVRLHEQEIRAVAVGAERSGDLDPASLQRQVASAHQQFPGFANVYAANARGRTVAFHPERGASGQSLIGLDFSGRDYVRRLRDTRQTVISDVFQGSVDEKPLIVVAHPILRADTMAGYVLGALDLDAFPAPQPAPGADARMRVADAGGRLLYDSGLRYRPGEAPRSVADSAAFLAVTAAGDAATVIYQPGGARTASGQEAARVMAGRARIPSLGWWVWVEQPVSAVQAFVAESYVRLLSLLIAVTLVALAVSDVLSAVLARPLLRMRATATALAAGQRGARVGPLTRAVPAEVAQLARDFDNMAEALAGRTEELEELGEIARTLAGTLETDEVLRRVTDAAARLVEADGCAIALVAPGGRLLHLSEHSLGMMAEVAGLELPVEASLLGWVAGNGEAVLLQDVMSDPRVARVSGGLTEAGSVICAPLLGRSGALGTLLAARLRGAYPFTESDLRLLERLSRHAAVAVENAHLVEAERRRARESESIRLVARTVSTVQGLEDTLEIVAREACGIVGADACRVLLLREAREGLEVVATSGVTPDAVGTVLPVEGELLRSPLRQGRAAIVDDGEHAAAVPLRVGDETLGVLAATRCDAPFGPEDARLLAAFADHAAVALRNAQLLEAAQAAARARAEFIATMSHELRTPLNAVLGHLQILEMEIHGPLTAEQRQSLGRIDAASRHLRGLIEEVLSFSRLEAGRAEVHVETVDVCALGAEVAAVIEPLATEKSLAFTLEEWEPHPLVRTDPDKVRQVLINLAGNAVKFTDEGEVRIRVRPRDGGVALSVIDTGPGIAAEDQERVFRPFEQLHSGFARPHGGTGLGLYLSGQYARMLGGSVEMDSAPGRGSTFTLILPAEPPADAGSPDPASTPGGTLHAAD
ncbi:GAF domain-containing protein [Longimicrobium sp.]|uniref:GAF domain-containing protein n=1 Tax=Longimicrobium sp. TaxID=2029185 RepID=UPI002E314318|nr:GAF domain-containing protein [Longimicrobium sp.]HEX6037954.1 GAF domain-containing protein [Longimicrobium sp.]